MKRSAYCIIATVLVITAVILAGCTGSRTSGTGTGSTETAGSSSSGGQVSVPATCPTAASGKGAWDGTWITIFDISKCIDERGKFNPPDAKVKEYFRASQGGEAWMNTTFTQNGCDVTGKASSDISAASTRPCQITFTGTASGTELKGTWKTYCNLKFTGAAESSVDNGVFDLYMEPGSGSTFIGTFTGPDADWSKKAYASCPNAHGNWVGKRG